MTLVKVKMVPVGGGSGITFMYNPTAISFTRTVEWKENKGSVGNSGNLPSVDYKGIKPFQIEIKDMLIDTYESRTSCHGYIDSLKGAVTPSDAADGTLDSEGASDGGIVNRKRPSVYSFELGANIKMNCVVTSLTYNYTMFLPNGDPVRAMVSLKLQEVDQIAAASDQQQSSGAQNRTANGRPGLG